MAEKSSDIDVNQEIVLGAGENVQCYIDGTLGKKNPFMTIMMIVFTLGTYLCFRLKHSTAVVVTQNRIIHYEKAITSGGGMFEYTQTAFYLRHFAYANYEYYQPKYTCIDWVTCEPCINFCTCQKLRAVVAVNLRFLDYAPSFQMQAGGFSASKAIGGCLGGGSASVMGGTASISLLMEMSTALPKLNNLIGAILVFHPFKKLVHAQRNPERLAFIDEGQQAEEHQVPIDRCGTHLNMITVVDGLVAYRVKWFERLLWAVTCGIWYLCWAYCCIVQKRYYVLTDRRVISFNFVTKGARTNRRLENAQFRALTEFYMLSVIHTCRVHNKVYVMQCIPGWPCCTKEEYEVRIKTEFGDIDFQIKYGVSFMTFIHTILSQKYFGALENFQPIPGTQTEVDSTRVKLLPGEVILASLEANRYTFIERLCRLPMLICTCGCFPRTGVCTLFITTHRIINLEEKKIPCTGKAMDTYVELYVLLRTLRVQIDLAKRFCRVCPMCACGTIQHLKISTDSMFEFSPEGEEVYEIKTVGSGSEQETYIKTLMAFLGSLRRPDYMKLPSLSGNPVY